MALSLTVAAAAAAYALYTYVGPFDRNAPAASIGQSASQSVMQTESVGDPLLVANPFDATEIFEFPAGTSEADAREAVAGFLIERAARRGVGSTRRHADSKG